MFRRAVLIGLAGLLSALPTSHATAQELTVPRVLDLLEGTTANIKSFDVNVETTVRFHLKHETAGDGSERHVASSRKLQPGENPTAQKKYNRQRYDLGKGRVEYLDGAAGKPTTVIVHDGESEKSLDLRRGTGLVRRPNAILLDDGGDYLESYRALYGRFSMVRSLRQRSDLTLQTSGAHVVLETHPDPKADIDFPQWGFRVSLDPSRGFIPVIVERFEIIKKKPFVTARRTVTDLKHIGGGIWAPTKVVTQLYDSDEENATFGELANEIELAVDVAKSSWNKPVTEAAFQFKFPTGVQVNDYFREVSYVTGKSDTGKNLKHLATYSRDLTPIVSKVYPVEEPRKIPYVLFAGIAATVLAGAAGTVFFIRRRKLEVQP